MNGYLHPEEVLYEGQRPFPSLPACEHYAGSEKLIRKALALQAELGPIFDITCDCEDGAAAGQEVAHAEMVATLIMDSSNLFGRVGARIHSVHHAHWQADLEIIVSRAGSRLAYVVFPKPESADDALTQIAYLNDVRKHYGIERQIPAHVLIETHGALREAWQIAALPHVESIDFGLMDFVSAHNGAIPSSAMTSPGQFEHPLVVRAKAEIAAAALGNSVVPSHNVTTELRNPDVVREDARRARNEFGFLRMWSIHPSQIQPIVEAMRPELDAVSDATAILIAAQNAHWGPIQWNGRLHDRASYRYFWGLLQRARVTGMTLPADALTRFFH